VFDLMLKDTMIYGGFDPAFIDIDIHPLNSSKTGFIKELPEIGSHHSDTRLDFQPGGNGFNLCRTLATLGRNVTYVGPSSTFFEILVQDNSIPIQIKTIQNAEVNYTTILNLQDGEVQFNSIQGKLSIESLSEEIIKYYRKSPLKPISNVSLNPTSIEWVSLLLLSLEDEDILDSLEDSTDPLGMISSCSGTSYEGIIFVDPSDISHFERIDEFCKILVQLKKFEGEKYLSVNEYELAVLSKHFSKSPKELASFLDVPVILHTSDNVSFYGKEVINLKTKNLVNKVKFVGAGDCFNGAFIHSILDSHPITDSLSYAIEAASYLVETGKYPNALHISKRINS
jgi:sugar/nucleoside kinase (ribokinase family)